MIYKLSKKDSHLKNEITLSGSKSISNRALIIEALSSEHFNITHLSTARDTQILQKLLKSKATVLDAEAAGTTFRFMTAYLALQTETQILTGSQRMKSRPIGVLVDALRQLGASIQYLGKEGFPPLKIGSPQIGKTNQLRVPANVSSQYISALLMVAPALPRGLELQLSAKIVSRPYIEMTLNLMAFFGVKHKWEGDFIKIKPQKYTAKDFKVEADWSAASYYFAAAAFSESVDIQLNNLWKNSVQGDAVISKIMEEFGILTTFNEKGIRLRKSGKPITKTFKWNFIKCPDIAQTMAVVCAGLGTSGTFNGLETLRIKETDRIAALQAELKKVKVDFTEKARSPKDSGEEYFTIEGKAQIDAPLFQTYEDHRMAMAFAPLAMFGKIAIQDSFVVEKSYPAFWRDFKKLDFEIEEKTTF